MSQGMWDLSSQIRDGSCVPCTRKWMLNHWTTREVPNSYHLFKFKSCLKDPPKFPFTKSFANIYSAPKTCALEKPSSSGGCQRSNKRRGLAGANALPAVCTWSSFLRKPWGALQSGNSHQGTLMPESRRRQRSQAKRSVPDKEDTKEV